MTSTTPSSSEPGSSAPRPVAGKMMAALVDYCEKDNDHDVDPLSFRLEHIGREVNVGFYSRKREINLQSSFTVLG